MITHYGSSSPLALFPHYFTIGAVGRRRAPADFGGRSVMAILRASSTVIAESPVGNGQAARFLVFCRVLIAPNPFRNRLAT
jgi:hypothetical protein